VGTIEQGEKLSDRRLTCSQFDKSCTETGRSKPVVSPTGVKDFCTPILTAWVIPFSGKVLAAYYREQKGQASFQ